MNSSLQTESQLCICCGQQLIQSKTEKSECPDCQSIFFNTRKNYKYSDSYPVLRSHYIDAIRKNKFQSVKKWCEKAQLQLDGQRIFEFGFGSGATLDFFKKKSANVYGVEIVQSNLDYMISKSYDKDSLFQTIDAIPSSKKPFDYCFYFDSFEHILEPDLHLKKLNELTQPGSKAILVLPRADCWSRKILGSYWPHELPDHWIFYSKAGLIKLFQKNGWSYQSSFFPMKIINIEMVINHILVKMSIPYKVRLPFDISFPFNIGEIGIVFQKDN